ncbi:MAG: ankyrin repeat domain-containing protein [Acidobacteria bacterium]|nr:ankyrin repeat domain-containing protein [Acidobacteriota bacterium]
MNPSKHHAKELTAAVQARDIPTIEAMLRARPELVNMDISEKNEHRAIHYAVILRSTAITRLLMQHGADARKGIYPHRDATSALTLAFDRGFDDIVAIILEEEALRPSAPTPTHQPVPEPPALLAIAQGDAAALRGLHANGALDNPTTIDIFNHHPGLLTAAVHHDRPEILTLLLDLGFDPNERQRLANMDEIIYTAGAPLYTCVVENKPHLAEILLARGADPNAVVYTSGSPFYKAHSLHNQQFIHMLAKHGGILDPVSAGYACQTEAARQLLATAKDKTVAEDLLWSAAGGGDPEIVRLALPHIDWPANDTRWLWPLWQAFTCDGGIEAGLASFRLLLDRADPNSTDGGRTILHTIMARGEPEHLPFAELLLDKGARTDIRDHLLCSTPLGWACRWGRDHFVQFLLARGADPIEPDAEPWATPKAWTQKRRDAGLQAGG